MAHGAAPKSDRPLAILVATMNEMSTTRARRLLTQLAMDLRWTWVEPMRRPFAMLAPRAWIASNENPLEVLNAIDDDYLATRLSERGFQRVLDQAIAAHTREQERRRWYRPGAHRLHVAYVCSEFAIHECMQQYSGGLGVLAGDHLKSCSDLAVPLTGFGLLYRQGYYLQELRRDGSTRVVEPQWAFDHMPIEDTGHTICCPIGRSEVVARIMRIAVGDVDLLLLDADLPDNRPRDRALTRGLYRGDADLRLRQQVLLGVGAVHTAKAMDVNPTCWHLNEGHAAFCGIERIARMVEDGVDLNDARHRVAESTIFTTHTPVPAGHDRYDLGRCADVLRPTLRRAGMNRTDLASLGQEGDASGPLCMTVLALRLAQHVNGVAALHGQVSRDMWKDVYQCDAKDVPITHITNGVHPATWMPPLSVDFWQRSIGLRPVRATPRATAWKHAPEVDVDAFWALRNTLRHGLIQVARQRLVQQARRRGENPAAIELARSSLRDDALTIGFARRFATYKRAPLIFHDLDRLEALLGDTDRPVQILFAGKAHPLDVPGQKYARTVHEMCRRAGLQGKVALLEEYDMGLGRVLTSGCDVWLNTPHPAPRSQRDQRHEGTTQRRAQSLHRRWLVARSGRWSQWMDDRRPQRGHGRRPPRRGRRRCPVSPA